MGGWVVGHERCRRGRDAHTRRTRSKDEREVESLAVYNFRIGGQDREARDVLDRLDRGHPREAGARVQHKHQDLQGGVNTVTTHMLINRGRETHLRKLDELPCYKGFHRVGRLLPLEDEQQPEETSPDKGDNVIK